MPPALLHEYVQPSAAPAEDARLSSWPTLLLVDGDLELSRAIVRHFERRGFHVAAAASLAEARQFVHRRKTWTLVIADCHLSDGTGWELQAWLKDQGGTTRFLLLSGSPFSATLCAGVDYLNKPFSLARIEARVNVLIGR